MNKELNHLLETYTDNQNFDYSCYISIENKLKALEIIKEKQVNVRNLIIYCFEMKREYENYIEMFNFSDNFWELGKDLLTQEEYDLLKEVLTCQS